MPRQDEPGLCAAAHRAAHPLYPVDKDDAEATSLDKGSKALGRVDDLVTIAVLTAIGAGIIVPPKGQPDIARGDAAESRQLVAGWCGGGRALTAT